MEWKGNFSLEYERCQNGMEYFNGTEDNFHTSNLDFVHSIYRKTDTNGIYHQGLQYGTVRSEFAYYVPRSFNRTVPAYRTSAQFLKRTVPMYRTRTITKKKDRTSVPYFSAKLEAYRTAPTYCSVLPSLLLITRNFS